MEIGEQIVAQNNSLPLESVSIVVGSIDSAITRLILQRHMPGVDPAEIDRKIGLLESAKGHMTEALAGLMAAREGYATYLGDTAMTDVGENFKF